MWFAFNYWYYDLWIQHWPTESLTWFSCDLLSITGITIFEYNRMRPSIRLTCVVICFQLLVLRSLNTTPSITNTKSNALWFAFNYWYYDLWIQLPKDFSPIVGSCDLLSITGITIFEYNDCGKFSVSHDVVICFQLLVLRSLNTTLLISSHPACLLWFAFNYWYYDLWIQLSRPVYKLSDRCDLLSITGITIFEYNFAKYHLKAVPVVICFQLLVLRSLNTTWTIKKSTIKTLWFAFNYWYYDLWIQLYRHTRF